MARQDRKSLDRIMVSLRLKKPEGGLSREQAMTAWPIRNPSLATQENDDGLISVQLPRRKDWMGGVLGFLFFVPEAKPVQLDEIGSFVWQRCDGDHTVNDIAVALSEEYKITRREAEVSLTQFLQNLAKRGMIAFAIPRDIAEAAGIQGEPMTLVEGPGEPEQAEEPPAED
jgi:hypothetical protein